MTKKFSKLLPMIGCFSLGLASSAMSNSVTQNHTYSSFQESLENAPIDAAKTHEFMYLAQDTSTFTEKRPFLDIDKLVASGCKLSVGDCVRMMKDTDKFIESLASLDSTSLSFYIAWLDELKFYADCTLNPSRAKAYSHVKSIYYSSLANSSLTLAIPLLTSNFNPSDTRTSDSAFFIIDTDDFYRLIDSSIISEVLKRYLNDARLSGESIENLYDELNSVQELLKHPYYVESSSNIEKMTSLYDNIKSGQSNGRISSMKISEYNSIFGTSYTLGDFVYAPRVLTHHDAQRNLTFHVQGSCMVTDPLGNPIILVSYTKERN